MPDELRRGFKSEAEDLAELVRAELDLGVLDRLDCYVLAETWGIPIVTLGELREDGAKEESIKRLLGPAAGFSAATVCVGYRRLIVYNPRHSTGRIANSLAHGSPITSLSTSPHPRSGSGVAATGTAPRSRRQTGWQAPYSFHAKAHSPGSAAATTTNPVHNTSASASSCSPGARTTPAPPAKSPTLGLAGGRPRADGHALRTLSAPSPGQHQHRPRQPIQHRRPGPLSQIRSPSGWLYMPIAWYPEST